MPSFKDLLDLKPVQTECTSDVEFGRLSILWEEHIAPTIVDLERIALTRPEPGSFEDNESFEEAYGFWMGRQGRVFSLRLSGKIREWQVLIGHEL